MAIPQKSNPERIYEDLKSKIRSGIVTLGARLPTEKELAADYGVAVLTLRKALTRLREEGWIVSRRYHGTHASHPDQKKSYSKLIYLIIPYGLHTLSHPVFSRLVDGIEGVLSEKGWKLQLAISQPSDPAREQALFEAIKKPEAAGWLIPTVISSEARELLRKVATPKVLLHFPDVRLSEHCLEVDYLELGTQVLSHLGEQGYRKVCFLGPASTQNLQAALQTLAGSNLISVPMEVRVVETPGVSLQTAKATCLEYLKAHQVDAFICFDDEMACGAMEALKERGLKAPQVGVVGGGDFPFGVMTDPPLSTVSYPYFQVGRQATQLLLDVIEGRPVEPSHTRFLPKFIPRESSLLSVTRPRNLNAISHE